MRRVLELFLISAMVLGSALGAQEENGVLREQTSSGVFGC